MVADVGVTYGRYIVGIASIVAGVVLFIKALNKKKKVDVKEC